MDFELEGGVQAAAAVAVLGSTIMQNDPAKVLDELLVRGNHEQLQAALSAISDSHDEGSRMVGVTEALFCEVLNPIDALVADLQGSKEGLVSVVSSGAQFTQKQSNLSYFRNPRK